MELRLTWASQTEGARFTKLTYSLFVGTGLVIMGNAYLTSPYYSFIYGIHLVAVELTAPGPWSLSALLFFYLCDHAPITIESRGKTLATSVTVQEFTRLRVLRNSVIKSLVETYVS